MSDLTDLDKQTATGTASTGWTRVRGRLVEYARLMRLDRPIGAWLLFWPCAWSVALAGMGPSGWILILWLALGAWAMRSSSIR